MATDHTTNTKMKTMPTIRPYINEDLVIKVKLAFPKETALMDIGATVEFAIEKALDCAKKSIADNRNKEA